MIEPEMAFCDLQGDMDLGEEFIKAMAKYALEHCVMVWKKGTSGNPSGRKPGSKLYG